MKITKFLMASLLLSAFTFVSCSDDDNNTPTTPVDEVVILEGNLETTTLTKDNKYLLRGQVFVRDGKVLTIQPGTIIKGDKATKGTLIIDRGGKIEAVGTATEPIVMTSNLAVGERDRGDWGGLVILGRATNNQRNAPGSSTEWPQIEGISPAVEHGGNIDNDDSGALVYVRVEYAGIELSPNNETNSITLGSVGSQTQLEYCQVSFGGDDGFEWFGGTVNGKYLISFASWDDSFDVDFGYSGKNQFGVEVRYPSFADQSGSNSFECDNGPADNAYTSYTTGVFSNFTCIGPKATNTQSISASYQHSIDLRRATAVTIANSVFVGYPRGIRMNQQSVYNNFNNDGRGNLLNNVLHHVGSSKFTVGSGMTATAADLEAYWTANGNTTNSNEDFAAALTALGINGNVFFGANVTSGYSSNPSFAVTSGLLTSGASFTNSKLEGLDTTTYVGAFGANDWTDGWASFLPNSNPY
ncbi:hypothetical protein [Flavobacterium lacus]|uniref:T9SS C-terminal target domain-containing protein n=1 Tax=Flavobacterium lacus TaxID=1353778 RepID=A0A328X1A1_9FLAO|nr:hypothetical protein [Flavobacterium lacus]RAR50377.1 hypothetical protein B0I10_102176 [Flavobacterium lacus]